MMVMKRSLVTEKEYMIIRAPHVERMLLKGTNEQTIWKISFLHLPIALNHTGGNLMQRDGRAEKSTAV
jgi:hypothetical protein